LYTVFTIQTLKIFDFFFCVSLKFDFFVQTLLKTVILTLEIFKIAKSLCFSRRFRIWHYTSNLVKILAHRTQFSMSYFFVLDGNPGKSKFSIILHEGPLGLLATVGGYRGPWAATSSRRGLWGAMWLWVLGRLRPSLDQPNRAQGIITTFIMRVFCTL
jgi:hypothetical protein